MVLQSCTDSKNFSFFSLFPCCNKKKSLDGHSISSQSPQDCSATSSGFLVCYFAAVGLVFIVGLGLTLNGFLFSIATMETFGEILLVGSFVAHFLTFAACASIAFVK